MEADGFSARSTKSFNNKLAGNITFIRVTQQCILSWLSDALTPLVGQLSAEIKEKVQKISLKIIKK